MKRTGTQQALIVLTQVIAAQSEINAAFLSRQFLKRARGALPLHEKQRLRTLARIADGVLRGLQDLDEERTL